MTKETKTNKATDEFMQKRNALKNAFGTLACGQWWYRGYVKSLNTAILEWSLGDLPKKKGMPEKLMLSNENSGTDLKNSVYFDEGYLGISSLDASFSFFFLDRGEKLIVYPTKVNHRDIPAKDLVYHIYEKHGSYTYTEADIRVILNKINKKSEFTTKAPLSEKLFGHYEIYDEILESDVPAYKGKIKTEDACFLLSPLFDIIDITAEGAYILEEKEKINIKYSEERQKTLTRENTMLKTYMHDTDKNKFGAYDTQRDVNYSFELKTIGGKQYLFANLNDDRDADETIYVYVKKGEVKAPKKATTTAKKAPKKATTKSSSTKAKPAKKIASTKTTAKTTKTTKRK